MTSSGPHESGGFRLRSPGAMMPRFAVHRLAWRRASPRSHGVPRRDVPGRVQVGVAGEATDHACEESLALAALRCDVPARAGTLTCERGADSLNPAGGLVFQPAHQFAPARSHNRSVEPGLGPYIPARLGNGATRRTGHACDLEILDPDHVEPAGKAGARLFAPVLASVGLVALQPGDGQLDGPTPVAGALRPGKLALKPQKPTLAGWAKTGDGQHLAGGQRGRDGNAPIDPDHFAVPRSGNWFGNCCEGDMPVASSVICYPVGLDAIGDWPRAAEPHPADLRNPDRGNLPAQRAHMPGSDPYDAEPSRVLLDGQVPDEPRVRAMLAQYSLLGWRNEEAVSGHAKTLSTSPDIPEEVKRRFRTRPKADVPTPRS